VSKADRIAMWIKAQPLLKLASEIQMSPEVLDLLRANREPCDPPDLLDGAVPSFCGVDIRVRRDWYGQIGFTIKLPLEREMGLAHDPHP